MQEAEKTKEPNKPGVVQQLDVEGQVSRDADVFGNEEGAHIQYKTCKWW
jgi:hypothetical protein